MIENILWLVFCISNNVSMARFIPDLKDGVFSRPLVKIIPRGNAIHPRISIRRKLDAVMEKQKSFDKDFSSWCLFQAKALKKSRFDLLDIENLIEEMHALVSSEKRELVNRLVVLFSHLLKHIVQKDYEDKSSWTLTIKVQRRDIESHLSMNKGLRKIYLKQASEIAYDKAKLEAMKETRLSLSSFPEEMPFTLEQALDENWMPSDMRYPD